MESPLIGKHVRIVAVKPMGSVRLLHSLTGTVVADHPVASGWVKVHLDPNGVTPHTEWSVPAERLVVLDREKRQHDATA